MPPDYILKNMTNINVTKRQQVILHSVWKIHVDRYQFDDRCNECQTVKLNSLSNFLAMW